jgi:hypothetical protein
MKSLQDYSVGELRLIYRILHSNLPLNPELMDSELLQDLQALLQKRAQQDGVDVSLHAQWANWLNGGPDVKGL